MRGRLLILAAGLMLAGPANAQIMLQGAIPPGAPGSANPSSPDGAPAAPKPLPPPVRAPAEDAVTGRDLLLYGTRGALRLEGRDKSLRVSKLTIEGELATAPGEACRVEAATGLDLVPDGRPAGVPRYNFTVAACAFSFDVLDGAVLVKGPACDMQATQCRIDPAGLWGPSAASLKGEQLTKIERSRRQAEDLVRTYFKALIASAKGRDETKRIAAEQAGFSSRREEVCSNYQRETQHGFCGARITEARAFSLRAEIDRTAPGALAKPKPVARPAAPVAPRPASAPMGQGGLF